MYILTYVHSLFVSRFMCYKTFSGLASTGPFAGGVYLSKIYIYICINK